MTTVSFNSELRYGPYGPSVVVWRQNTKKTLKEEYVFNFQCTNHNFVLLSYKKFDRDKKGYWQVLTYWERGRYYSSPCPMKIKDVPKLANAKELVLDTFIKSLKLSPFEGVKDAPDTVDKVVRRKLAPSRVGQSEKANKPKKGGGTKRR